LAQPGAMHATGTMPAAATVPFNAGGLQILRSTFVRPIDVHTTTLAIAILFLNLVDGFATLRHLTHGAEELNPLMQLLLSHSAAAFLLVKHLLASLGVIGIAMHGRVRAARIALWI